MDKATLDSFQAMYEARWDDLLLDEFFAYLDVSVSRFKMNIYRHRRNETDPTFSMQSFKDDVSSVLEDMLDNVFEEYKGGDEN